VLSPFKKEIGREGGRRGPFSFFIYFFLLVGEDGGRESKRKHNYMLRV